MQMVLWSPTDAAVGLEPLLPPPPKSQSSQLTARLNYELSAAGVASAGAGLAGGAAGSS